MCSFSSLTLTSYISLQHLHSLHYSPTQLFVTIVDQNDNSPVFQNGPYLAEVTEGVAKGFDTEIVVMATDEDKDVFGTVSYSLTRNESECQLNPLIYRKVIMTLSDIYVPEQRHHFSPTFKSPVLSPPFPPSPSSHLCTTTDSTFSINPTSGVLTVNNTVDRETNPTYDLVVEVCCMGGCGVARH